MSKRYSKKLVNLIGDFVADVLHAAGSQTDEDVDGTIQQLALELYENLKRLVDR